ncbi:MAG: GNAT family N-acetyltransferase [Gammaproteobacteria bacterium]|nr:GNAT family N-acetyltransferase [Gammaproteobacteria bacterium]
MDIRLRAGRGDDAGAITALVNSAYRGDTGRQGWTTEADLLDGSRISLANVQALLADADCTLLLGEAGGRLVACVELRRTGGQLYIGMLSVAPGLQGRGIGSLLMEAAEDHARRLGLDSLAMLVISRRHELIAWYLRQGFLPTGETRAFRFADASFGIPRLPLEFMVLEKPLHGGSL